MLALHDNYLEHSVSLNRVRVCRPRGPSPSSGGRRLSPALHTQPQDIDVLFAYRKKIARLEQLLQV